MVFILGEPQGLGTVCSLAVFALGQAGHLAKRLGTVVGEKLHRSTLPPKGLKKRAWGTLNRTTFLVKYSCVNLK